MDKPALRSHLRARRRAGHTPSADFPQRVLDAVPDGTVCCYVSLPAEPPTPEIIQGLLERGQSVYLPVAAAHGILHWVAAASVHPWDAWGVPGRAPLPVAPVPLPAVACIIVPALAVDRCGRRLGQGGGYYDRFLPSQPGARRLALVWADEVVERVPADPHDSRVDCWVVADG
ncbi:MAG TPA: 5-formyltetrahydrofolate cyclo-ligase [Actinomycetota bacterium]|nr:5-formyltetrahydrofolate cyclo-ligase [Actinomycetota bacterium]